MVGPSLIVGVWTPTWASNPGVGEQEVGSGSSSAGSSATSNSAPRWLAAADPQGHRSQGAGSGPDLHRRVRVAELTVLRQSSISSGRSNPTISEGVGTLLASAAMKSSSPPMYNDQKSTSVATNHRRSSGQNRSGLRHSFVGGG